MDTLRRGSKKVFIGTVGGIVVIAGIIMIPYPGPGWLVVFIGLGILATEFPWAARLLQRARGFYDAWAAWLKRQALWVRLVVLALTGLVVIVTLWLLNAYGLIDDWFHLGLDWVHSPLIKH